MLNTVILIGRLTKDPEGTRTKAGTPVASFSLAVDNPTKNEEGNYTTSFIPCQMWDKLVTNTFKFLHKGSKIALKGRLNQRTFTTKEGKNASVLEVIADSITLLDPKPATDEKPSTVEKAVKETKKENKQELPKDDDLPF
jgi:single-strand DNA-binding protein